MSDHQFFVNEIFGPTIQGEGPHAGQPAVFVRLAGCNLKCWFCDTDHQHGTEMTIGEITKRIRDRMQHGLVVLTGGEPMIQNGIEHLVKVLMSYPYRVQIETNGTVDEPEWLRYGTSFIKFRPTIVCSPKSEKINLNQVDALKLIYPWVGAARPEAFTESRPELRLCEWWGIQPADVGVQKTIVYGNRQINIPNWESLENINQAIQEVKRLGYPWRLSLQVHKLIGEE